MTTKARAQRKKQKTTPISPAPRSASPKSTNPEASTITPNPTPPAPQPSPDTAEQTNPTHPKKQQPKPTHKSKQKVTTSPIPSPPETIPLKCKTQSRSNEHTTAGPSTKPRNAETFHCAEAAKRFEKLKNKKLWPERGFLLAAFELPAYITAVIEKH
ncbi:extensin-like [Humulus lupulus]|uniref:extensin-like n=1 Tax=Humulus lupulus TaxID=3486 RepID=UPI002B4163BE|nr:extensin-like [Humulus lupulus]